MSQQVLNQQDAIIRAFCFRNRRTGIALRQVGKYNSCTYSGKILDYDMSNIDNNTYIYVK
jgi:hypothetical protein